MKRLTAILMMLSLAFPAWAAAELEMNMEQKEENGQTLIVFSATEAQTEKTTPASDETPDPALLMANGLIESRFEQAKAAQLTRRVGAEIMQSGEIYTFGNIASLVLHWNGTQSDGTAGSAARGLVLDRTTGEEIRLEQLFDDADAAFDAMETIIADDVLAQLSDYMEYGDLLPMPRDNYAVDAYGLTVFYPDDSYRYFDEQSGAVQFAWYELADYIGESSPVYALAHEQGDMNALTDAAGAGRLPGPMEQAAVGQKLGEVLSAYTLLTDPDYTKDSRVYLFEEANLRGWAVEIPKYAETDEDETPISAIRTTRASVCGLTVGQTTKEQMIEWLGEPKETRRYDADDAADRMLEAGESLFFELSGHILQAHADENGVLSCLILRGAMPEDLY